jgi:hypothetical protein
MTLDTTSKAGRRQIAADFKDRKVPRGVFAIRCAASGQCWVGSSTNLTAVQNSQWFQLRGGLHRNPTLQQAWTHQTEQAFSLETLEELDDDLSPLLLNQQLAARKAYWANSLQADIL